MNKNIWNVWLIAVTWNNPPNSPIPFFKLRIVICNDIIEQYIKIIIVTREYNIDLSRLSVTALDNSKYKREFNNIFPIKDLNFDLDIRSILLYH